MGIPRLLKRTRGSEPQHKDRHRWLALPALRPQSDPARNRDAVITTWHFSPSLLRSGSFQAINTSGIQLPLRCPNMKTVFMFGHLSGNWIPDVLIAWNEPDRRSDGEKCHVVMT